MRSLKLRLYRSMFSQRNAFLRKGLQGKIPDLGRVRRNQSVQK